MRICPFCPDSELIEDVGADDEGEVRSFLRCACCEREFADVGERWNPVEIRTRVAMALERERAVVDRIDIEERRAGPA